MELVNLRLKSKIVLHYGTQSMFSRHVDEDTTMISKVIHGDRDLDDKTKKKWAKLLKSTVGEIF